MTTSKIGIFAQSTVNAKNKKDLDLNLYLCALTVDCGKITILEVVCLPKKNIAFANVLL